jgi:hypothetical protein
VPLCVNVSSGGDFPLDATFTQTTQSVAARRCIPSRLVLHAILASLTARRGRLGDAPSSWTEPKPPRQESRSPRHRRGKPAAVAMFIVAALILSAPGAGANTSRAGFFGVGGWSYPSDNQFAALGSAGVRLVRGALTWGEIQSTPDPTSRNWTYADQFARDAASNRMNIIFDLNGCAVWACGTVNAPPTGAELTAYESFVAAAVARYDESSPFWAGEPYTPHISWQVWNEVNGGYFWPNPTPAAYATFLGQIAATIRSVDPGATVVMSGLVAIPSVSSGIALEPFLNGLYEQPGFTSNTAAIAVHGYAPSAAATLNVLDEARRVTLEHHDAARPLWVTEMSWATGGPPFPFTVTPATQNAYLIQSWDQMLACAPRWNLQHVLWFSLQDVSSSAFGQPDGWYFYDGLLNPDGSPKQAYASFLQFVGPGSVPGDASECTLPGGLTLDITNPHTVILSAPRYTNNTRSQIVTFDATENGKAVAGMRYECSLDETPWVPCVSPLNAANDREGDHTLLVRGIDPEGNVDPNPASVTWLLDLTPPDTIITGHSAISGPPRKVRIRFYGVDAGGISHFQCRVDSRGWKRCQSPFVSSLVTPGEHTIAVRAVDRAGNIDPSPATVSFAVRAVNPSRAR